MFLSDFCSFNQKHLFDSKILLLSLQIVHISSCELELFFLINMSQPVPPEELFRNEDEESDWYDDYGYDDD